MASRHEDANIVLYENTNMRRIVFTNNTGGVGKTTSVANLAVGLSSRGVTTLVIDMDPQANVTFALLGQRPPEAGNGYIPPTAYALLAGHYPLSQVILPVPRYANLSIIPANSDLADAALKVARRPTRLRRLLDDLPADAYQVVLIDNGKGLDPLSVNALAAADEVILMVSPGRLELDAIARMQEHVALCYFYPPPPIGARRLLWERVCWRRRPAGFYQLPARGRSSRFSTMTCCRQLL